jgi:hypothetical protein
MSTAILITTKCRWRQWDVRYRYIRAVRDEQHVQQIQLMDGTYKHIIYVKQTKSERVSYTVFFKTKFITQPTMTHADIITKALNDLTQALKGKNNHIGLEQIEALTKLDNIRR